MGAVAASGCADNAYLDSAGSLPRSFIIDPEDGFYEFTLSFTSDRCESFLMGDRLLISIAICPLTDYVQVILASPDGSVRTSNQ